VPEALRSCPADTAPPVLHKLRRRSHRPGLRRMAQACPIPLLICAAGDPQRRRWLRKTERRPGLGHPSAVMVCRSSCPRPSPRPWPRRRQRWGPWCPRLGYDERRQGWLAPHSWCSDSRPQRAGHVWSGGLMLDDGIAYRAPALARHCPGESPRRPLPVLRNPRHRCPDRQTIASYPRCGLGCRLLERLAPPRPGIASEHRPIRRALHARSSRPPPPPPGRPQWASCEAAPPPMRTFASKPDDNPTQTSPPSTCSAAESRLLVIEQQHPRTPPAGGYPRCAGRSRRSDWQPLDQQTISFQR